MIFNQVKKKRKISHYTELLEMLIQSEYTKMYRIAFSYTHNREEALDVVQDTFQKALIYFEKAEEIDDFNAWFYKVLIRTAIDNWRKKKRAPSTVDMNERVILETFEEPANITHTELWSVLDQTPSPDREIIILKFFEGFSLRDIAHILEINENTVKTRMYRSLNTLRKVLE